MTGDTPVQQPGKDLDELIAQFEEVARKRPTPAELAEAERTGTEVRHEEPPEPEPAELPIAAPDLAPDLAPDVAATVAPAQPPLPAPTPLAAPSGAPPATDPGAVATGRVESLEQWWAGGARVEVQLPGGAVYSIFVRLVGEGPWMTLIHGFPTSSWDWAPIAGALSSRYRLLALDLLGFGDSDKPSGHNFSAFEQADIVEAIWRHFGVGEARVVAHDVGMTVALELLARHGEGRLGTRISDCTLLNGGVYAAHHRPRRVQVWLQRPVIGALIASRMSEPRFARGFAQIFGPEHKPSADELRQHWLAVARRNGYRNYHRLIKYIPERRANSARWEGAVESPAIPIRFVWGMVDPVSGAHMAAAIREKRPAADIVELADVGHYPQLEAPDRVTAAIIEGPRPGAEEPATTDK